MNRNRTEQSNKMALLLDFNAVHTDFSKNLLPFVLLSNVPRVVFIICDLGHRLIQGSMNHQ
jgi:hypothetical protein